MLENVLLIIAGFFLLIKGADILVDGSSAIAKKMNISKLVIGLTIVAIGTSLPELIIGIKTSLIGQSNVVMGSIIGSNLFNLLFILGICSIIYPLKFKNESRFIDIPISLVIVFTLFVLANNSGLDKSISKLEGCVLLVLFICFFTYTIFMTKYGEILEPKVQLISDDEEYSSVFKNILYIILGILALKFGGDFVVENISELIKNFGADERLLGLTLISICTSLPELSTSIIASLKKEDDIAVGNIIGSNVFNLSLILGVSSIVSPISFLESYNIDLMILFLANVVVLISSFIGRKNYITRLNGIALIIGYIGCIIHWFG